MYKLIDLVTDEVGPQSWQTYHEAQKHASRTQIIVTDDAIE